MNIYPLLLHPAEESECVSTVHGDGRSHRDVTHSLANALKPRDWVAVRGILSFQFETRKYHIWTCGQYLRWAMIGAPEQHVPAMLAHPPIGRPQLYAHFCSNIFYLSKLNKMDISLFTIIFGRPCWPKNRMQIFGSYLKPYAPPILKYSQRSQWKHESGP